MELTPKTLANNWSQVDVALYKTNYYQDTSWVYYGYIIDNQGYIAKAPIDAYDVLLPVSELGACKKVSIDFDLVFKKANDGTYDYKCVGDPVAVYIDTNNVLWLLQNGTKAQLATGVSDCYITRGWTNVLTSDIDQGFLVTYVQNGVGYYLNVLKGVPTGAKDFGMEEVVESITSYRTLDYRVVFSIVLQTKVVLLETDRYWAGIAFPNEILYPMNLTSSATISYKETGKIVLPEVLEIAKPATTKTAVTYDMTSNSIISKARYMSATNVGGDTILLTMPYVLYPVKDMKLINANISIRDGRGIAYAIADYHYASNNMVITTSNFNNAKGIMKVCINDRAELVSIDNQVVPEMCCEFVPQGLVPYPTNPPQVVSITNIGNTQIEMKFDRGLSGNITDVWKDVFVEGLELKSTNQSEYERKRRYAISSYPKEGATDTIVVNWDVNDSFRNSNGTTKLTYVCYESIIWGPTELDVVEMIDQEVVLTGLTPLYNIADYPRLTPKDKPRTSSLTYDWVTATAYDMLEKPILKPKNLISVADITYQLLKPIVP